MRFVKTIVLPGVFSVVCACSLLAAAKPLLLVQDETLGVNIVPPEERTWQSKTLYMHRPHTAADLRARPGEFFELEYGKPLEAFAFTNGWSRLWGSVGDTSYEPGIRFGRGWGDYIMCQWAVVADVEQNVPSSKWTLYSYSGRHSGSQKLVFDTGAAGRKTVTVPMGMFKMPSEIKGFKLVCDDTNAVKGVVRSLKFVATELPVSYRHRFTLTEKPAFAAVSFPGRPHSLLTVNGKTVWRGINVRGEGGTLNQAITDKLVVGENEVVFTRDAGAGWSTDTTCLIELFTVSEKGETWVMPSEKGWECRYGDGEWKPAKVGTLPGIRWLANGRKYQSGANPLHAGPLQVKPRDIPFPVFDEKEENVWSVWVPKGLMDAAVEVEVKDAFTGVKVEEVRVGVGVRERNLTTCAVEKEVRVGVGVRERNLTTCAPAALNGALGDRPLPSEQQNKEGDLHSRTRTPTRTRTRTRTPTRTFSFSGLKTGAYDVIWKLVRDGKTIDSQKTEMVVAGPLGLKEFERDEIEPYLQKHKKLVWSVDPTDGKWQGVSSNFIGHAGMYAKPAVDMGRVVTEAGRKVRETGTSEGAFLIWHVEVGKLGAPHIVEIDYPDTREQLIYSAVDEAYPYWFGLNWSMSLGFPNATGSVRTGGRAPLSGKMQTLRYVFFPGSRNATVSFESGLADKPAACAAIRVYELTAPLPAWRLPKTDRIFMRHSEHPVFGNWGAWRSPVSCSNGGWGYYEPYRWSALYAATVNRIQQLRFEGDNAAVEGVYMYSNGFPTFSGESNEAHESFDLCYLIAKMYRANGIRFFAGFEYLASPKLGSKGAYDTSERELWEGRGRPPSHLVDKNGRIPIEFGGTGLDNDDPIVRTSITNLVSAIYRRYDGLGVAGLFVLSGGFWLPGLAVGFANNAADDVGYGDLTVAAFERDTGISLGTGTTGRERFRRRYELLTGRYSDEWRRWRSLNMRSSVEAIESVVRGGADTWTVYVTPGLREKVENPFTELTSTPESRDTYVSRGLADAAFDLSCYGRGAKTSVRLIPRINYGPKRGEFYEGILTSRGVHEAIRSNDAVYFNPSQMNERDYRIDALKEHSWWWRGTARNTYEVKYGGAVAYSDFVDVLAEYTPRMLVHTWTDCNLDTAHDAATRDFLSGFYATPLGDGVRYDQVKGADAHLYGGKLQLVNDTAWTLRAVGEDLTLAPYAVMVLETPRALTFRFEPSVAARVKADLDALLVNGAVIGRIRPDVAKELKRCAQAGDLYRAEVLMCGWEVQNILARARTSDGALKNQAELEAMLAKEGTVRINCGCLNYDKWDERGRRWLCDQRYTGFGAYGHEFATMVWRGPIPIGNTDTPTPYRWEAGGRILAYHVPVPAGRYRVVLHFAETWDTSPGRVMDVTVNGATKKVIPWEAGGRCVASTTEWEDVTPNDGRIDVRIAASAILNGIELFRVDK